MNAPIWFITGCSSGFGASLALRALRSGHKVIATSRTPSKTPELVSQVEKLGGTWLQLDICSPNLPKVVETAMSLHGRIDVLVNNAGYALLGAFESMSEKDCRSQMDTNFFAPLNIIRLILPSMRQRRSGTIVNISSTAGIEAQPSRSLYSGSKFALEGFSEALYHEVQPFGVRVLVVEPGAFRTNFASGVVSPELPLPEEYKGTTTDKTIEAVRAMNTGNMRGDVEKGSRAIFDVVMKCGQAEGMEEFLRLPLGADGSARWKLKLEQLQSNLDGTEHIWKNTDFDQGGQEF